jgi:hypothetical protein
MTVAHVQDTALRTIDNSTGTTITFPANTTVGNTLCCGIDLNTAVATTGDAAYIHPTGGGVTTWTPVTSSGTTFPTSGTNTTMLLFVGTVTSSGVKTITINNPSANYWGAAASEFSGVDASTFISKYNVNKSTGSSPNVGTLVPTAAGQLAFVAQGNNNGNSASPYTAGSPWTKGTVFSFGSGVGDYGNVDWLITTSTTTLSPSYVYSGTTADSSVAGFILAPTVTSVSGTASVALGPLTLTSTGVKSPPPVAGYTAWWDASQITGHADNTSLTSWADSSGNSHNLTTVDGTAPIYYASTAGKTVNGLPAVWFASGGLYTAAMTLNQPFTIAAVCESTVVGGAYGVVGGNGGNTGLSLISGPFRLYAGNTLAATVPGDTNLHAAFGVANGGSSVVQVDSTSTSGNAGSNFLASSSAVYLGELSASTYPWSGPICEVLIYPSALSGAQISSLLSYFQAKWFPSILTGTATLALGPLSLTATGTVSAGLVSGTATLALGPLALTVIGQPIELGTASLPLGPLTLTATGTASTVTVSGTATAALGPLTLSATGIVEGIVSGIAAFALGPLTLTAVSAGTVDGVATLQLGPLLLFVTGPAAATIGTICADLVQLNRVDISVQAVNRIDAEVAILECCV